MRTVVVSKAVSERIRTAGLDRAVMLTLLNDIHLNLPGLYPKARMVRDPDDSTLFLYTVRCVFGGRWHVATFQVNDTTSADRLLVESVSF